MISYPNSGDNKDNYPKARTLYGKKGYISIINYFEQDGYSTMNMDQ